MRSFRDWLEKPLAVRDLAKFSLIIFALNFVWNIGILAVVMCFRGNFPARPSPIDTGSVLDVGDLFALLGMVFVCACQEEYMYRFLPIALSLDGDRVNWKTFASVFLVSFLLFGWLHGGWWRVPIQGISGLFFAVIFLKGGGAYGRCWRGFCASSLSHFAYNGSLVLIVVALERLAK